MFRFVPFLELWVIAGKAVNVHGNMCMYENRRGITVSFRYGDKHISLKTAN